jgi:hypothetical protein
VYSTVVSPVVGSQFFFNSTQGATAPAGTYKIFVDNLWKTFTVNTGGVVTAVNICSWGSTKYNSDTYTANKNDCAAGACSVSGNSVTLNDNGTNTYITSGVYTSYISQADADVQAQAMADAAFVAGRQAKINEYGTCTWTYNNGSATYPATSFTRNNCSSGCYGTSVTYGAVTKSGYSAVSNNSCQDAVNSANASAYNAAQAESQSLGQANANTNGSCCCWVADPTCSGCNYLGNRERNTCTGEYRYTQVTAFNSCNCGNTCAGTYYSYFCAGQYNYDRYRVLKNVCDNSIAGSEELFLTCSGDCNKSSNPVYQNQNFVTCYFCSNVTVYRDINHCSGTDGSYYVLYNGNYVNVGDQPANVGCNYDSNCQDTGSARCEGPDYVIDRIQYNTCSNESCPVRVIEPNSVTYGCYNPCAGLNYPIYTPQNYQTCYNCINVDVYKDTNTCSDLEDHFFVDYYGFVDIGLTQPGGTCNYTPNCQDTGVAYCDGPNWVINQTQLNPCVGACSVRVIEPNSTTHNCYDPCGGNTAPIYTYQNYLTCYNCTNVSVYKDTNISTCSATSGSWYVYYGGSYVLRPGQPSPGNCYTTSNCQDTGTPRCEGPNWVIDRVQATPCSSAGCTSPWVLETNSQTNGCYTPPTCNLFDIMLAGGSPETVNISFTNCAGFPETTSTVNDGGDGYGGTICARPGTVYTTQGNASFISVGTCS